MAPLPRICSRLRSKCGPTLTTTALTGRKKGKVLEVVELESHGSESEGSSSKEQCVVAEREQALEVSEGESKDLGSSVVPGNDIDPSGAELF